MATSATMSSQDSVSHLRSIDRVHKYPIVSDSLITVVTYYKWLKSSNAMLDSTLSVAENTVNRVKSLSEPYTINKFQYLDQVCCNQLDKLEHSCPVILKPSRDIVPHTYSVCRQYATDTINASAQTALQIIDGTVGRSVNMLVPEALVNKAEVVIEQLLPAAKDVQDESKVEVNEENLKEETINKQSHGDKYARIKRLSRKSKQRLMHVAVSEILRLYRANIEILEQLKTAVMTGQLVTKGGKEISEFTAGAVSMVQGNVNKLLRTVPFEHKEDCSTDSKDQSVVVGVIRHAGQNVLYHLQRLQLLLVNRMTGSAAGKDDDQQITSVIGNDITDVINRTVGSLRQMLSGMLQLLSRSQHKQEMTEMSTINESDKTSESIVEESDVRNTYMEEENDDDDESDDDQDREDSDSVPSSEAEQSH